MAGIRRRASFASLLTEVVELGELGPSMAEADVDALMERTPQLFRALLREAGAYPESRITAVITKFRDAGRRSPPTAVASSRGPGRAKDAADGNRANRWQLPSQHRYYTDKRSAQLVEIRYYLQLLSMLDAPPLRSSRATTAFVWLLGHELRPGEYKDPIMLRDISFTRFLERPRRVTSGHLIPLARGGRHEPDNTFLMLSRANSLQGDLTFDEFLALIDDILTRQADDGVLPDPRKVPAYELLEQAEGTLTE